MKNVNEHLLQPIRNRILVTIRMLERASTRDIAVAQPDVSMSSLYKHLKALQNDGVIEVVGTRQIHGAKEKTYSLAEGVVVDPANMDVGKASEWIHSVKNYYLGILYILDKFERDFPDGPSEMGSLFVSLSAYVSRDELAELEDKVRELLEGVKGNENGKDRTLMSVSFLAAPASYTFEE